MRIYPTSTQHATPKINYARAASKVRAKLNTLPISWTEHHLLLAILKYYNFKDPSLCFPSIGLIAKETGITPQHTHKLIKKLEKEGYIKRTARKGRHKIWGTRKTSNSYEFGEIILSALENGGEEVRSPSDINIPKKREVKTSPKSSSDKEPGTWPLAKKPYFGPMTLTDEEAEAVLDLDEIVEGLPNTDTSKPAIISFAKNCVKMGLKRTKPMWQRHLQIFKETVEFIKSNRTLDLLPEDRISHSLGRLLCLGDIKKWIYVREKVLARNTSQTDRVVEYMPSEWGNIFV